jgi:hypothetical protein
VLDVDLEAALRTKIELNAHKYHIELARGNALKYTALAAKRAAES